MTRTIRSATTINKSYSLTIESEGEQVYAYDCTCPDRYYRGRFCKHIQAFNREFARAATFRSLWQQFDIRSESVKAAKRAAYLEYEFQCGTYNHYWN